MKTLYINEGKHTVNKVTIETEEGDTFVFSERNTDHSWDDGRNLVFESVVKYGEDDEIPE